MKILVIVDMQNDFIDGSLANPAAKSIVRDVAEYASSFKGLILFTRDTHDENYLETREGKKLTIPHCLLLSDGWKINKEIFSAAEANSDAKVLVCNKSTFSEPSTLYAAISTICDFPDEIEVCGTCTDICVISNVFALSCIYKNAKISVLKNLCAGSSKQRHEAAIEVMRSCQIDVID